MPQHIQKHGGWPNFLKFFLCVHWRVFVWMILDTIGRHVWTTIEGWVKIAANLHSLFPVGPLQRNIIRIGRNTKLGVEANERVIRRFQRQWNVPNHNIPSLQVPYSFSNILRDGRLKVCKLCRSEVGRETNTKGPYIFAWAWDWSGERWLVLNKKVVCVWWLVLIQEGWLLRFHFICKCIPVPAAFGRLWHMMDSMANCLCMCTDSTWTQWWPS